MSASPGSGQKIRVAVVGAGDFGRNHVRVYRELEDADLVGVVDSNPERARAVAEEFSTATLPGTEALTGRVDAVSLAVPTVEHARMGCRLLGLGIDVLVEKPMAASLAEADELIAAARQHRRVLQVGHLERFNPAVVAVERVLSRPLFFEVHRLGVFSPRSLDIDVVYDVMIHDLDILLALVSAPVTDLKAVGIPVLSDRVDIAHARIELQLPDGTSVALKEAVVLGGTRTWVLLGQTAYTLEPDFPPRLLRKWLLEPSMAFPSAMPVSSTVWC